MTCPKVGGKSAVTRPRTDDIITTVLPSITFPPCLGSLGCTTVLQTPGREVIDVAIKLEPLVERQPSEWQFVAFGPHPS